MESPVAKFPKTLQAAIAYFGDPDRAFDAAVALRWPNGITCPRCGSQEHSFISTRKIWFCKGCKKQFTVKVGSIFEDSPLGMDKWMFATWLVTNCKNGVSSCEVARHLGITQKSAWFMDHRIRAAMRSGSFDKLSGNVEADETFVGGKVTNMHRRSKRSIQAKNDGNWGKTVVLGLLEREGRVRAAVAPTRSHYDVHQNLLANVEPGSTLFTDEYNAYQSLPPEQFTHEIINKIEGYVKGRVHVNGMENFWSLMKRTLKGTYVSVDPVHLQAYCDEQVFRFNNRKDMNDSERFAVVMGKVSGKRLTWKTLTGKDQSSIPMA